MLSRQNCRHNDQTQWLAAIAELEADVLEATPVPSNFPQELEKREVAYQFWNCSEGSESAEGHWAKGPSPDGKGQFEYLASPKPMGETVVELGPPTEPRLYGTPKEPTLPSAV